MRIGGFSLPKIDLNQVRGGLVSATSAKPTLKQIIGDVFKSGLQAAKNTLLQHVAKVLGLPSPSATQGGVSTSLPSSPGVGGISSVTARANVEPTVIQNLSAKLPAGGSSVWDNAMSQALSPRGLSDKQQEHLNDPKLDKNERARLKAQYEMQNYTEMVSMISNLIKMRGEMQKAIIGNMR
ncbi:hypothetical protein [Archangium sp.]|uniref:hypothetical protein n=1 Tax=Archangium sp. TaxID=1872627 RepID=UPI002ED9D0EC